MAVASGGKGDEGRGVEGGGRGEDEGSGVVDVVVATGAAVAAEVVEAKERVCKGTRAGRGCEALQHRDGRVSSGCSCRRGKDVEEREEIERDAKAERSGGRAGEEELANRVAAEQRGRNMAERCSRAGSMAVRIGLSRVHSVRCTHQPRSTAVVGTEALAQQRVTRRARRRERERKQNKARSCARRASHAPRQTRFGWWRQTAAVPNSQFEPAAHNNGGWISVPRSVPFRRCRPQLSPPQRLGHVSRVVRASAADRDRTADASGVCTKQGELATIHTSA